jgi:REP element-mobilizing transposase RayT
MEDKYQKKYRISSPRLAGWDYGSHGLYFVTICTKHRVHYFDEVIQPENPDNAFVEYDDMGKIAFDNWLRIPEFYPFVKLDDFSIMPDHLHAILFIDKPDKTSWEVNKFGAQKENLAAVLRGYKSSIKTFANNNEIEFTWQPRYYDRVIRDDREYNNIREYIYENPKNWLSDKSGFENLYL